MSGTAPWEPTGALPPTGRHRLSSRRRGRVEGFIVGALLGVAVTAVVLGLADRPDPEPPATDLQRVQYLEAKVTALTNDNRALREMVASADEQNRRSEETPAP